MPCPDSKNGKEKKESHQKEERWKKEKENLTFSQTPATAGVCFSRQRLGPPLYPESMLQESHFRSKIEHMKYMLQGTNISISGSIEALVASKIKTLDRFVSRFDEATVEARIEVGKPSRHHHTGMVFYAEINLKIPGKLLRAEAMHLDLSFAISEAFKEIERQVKDYKEKIITKNKKFKT
ncbi:MAG: ribosome-associated translation inhibitor RaiA [bacterium]|nr:ribosome-associated translation inhibitor RaiA [bacterium]